MYFMKVCNPIGIHISQNPQEIKILFGFKYAKFAYSRSRVSREKSRGGITRQEISMRYGITFICGKHWMAAFYVERRLAFSEVEKLLTG